MNWHTKAHRLQAQHPHKPWSEICAMLARRPRRRRVTPQQAARRLEQLRLW